MRANSGQPIVWAEKYVEFVVCVERNFNVRLQRECLRDVFGSDGTIEGDDDAFTNEAISRIGAIAIQKARNGLASPIVVSTSDFKD